MPRLPDKPIITQIQDGDPLIPSVHNQPHSDLETEFDNLKSYIESTAAHHFQYDDVNTTGLTFEYLAGSVRKGNVVVDVAAGNLTMTDAVANYIEVDETGTVSTSTQGFSANAAPLYEVTPQNNDIKDGTAVITDRRTQSMINPIDSVFTEGNLIIGDGNGGLSDSGFHSSLVGKEPLEGTSIVFHNGALTRDNTGTDPYYSTVASGKIWDVSAQSNQLYFANFGNADDNSGPNTSSGIISQMNGTVTFNLDFYTAGAGYTGATSGSSKANSFSFNLCLWQALGTWLNSIYLTKYSVTGISIANLANQDTTTELTISLSDGGEYAGGFWVLNNWLTTETRNLTFNANNTWHTVVLYTVNPDSGNDYSCMFDMRAFWSGDELILESRVGATASTNTIHYATAELKVEYAEVAYQDSSTVFAREANLL